MARVLLICCSAGLMFISKKVTQDIDQLEVVETHSFIHDPSLQVAACGSSELAELVLGTLVPSSCIATVRLLR